MIFYIIGIFTVVYWMAKILVYALDKLGVLRSLCSSVCEPIGHFIKAAQEHQAGMDAAKEHESHIFDD